MQVLEIEDYELQYRVRGAATFLDWDHQGSATTATVSGLSPATTYEVRIRAITAAGAGDWSAAAHGATPEPVPRFEEGSEATRAIDENAPPDTAVGAPVRATAPHAVEYTLAGEDAGAFAIDAASGQLLTREGVEYDHETRPEHTLTVRASTGHGAADIAVTVRVADVDEPPGAPGTPEVESASSTRLTVRWGAPENTGPPIEGYDLEVREPDAEFRDAAHEGAETTASLTGLRRDTRYALRVRARNAEGVGPWSTEGSGSTRGRSGGGGGSSGGGSGGGGSSGGGSGGGTVDPPTANAPPVFVGHATLLVAENTRAVATLAATDADGDAIARYGIVDGADAALFVLDARSGALAFVDAPDFEGPRDSAGTDPPATAADNVHVLVAEVTSGSGTRALSAQRVLHVEVTDIPLEAPTGLAVESSTADSLTLNWTASENTGPPILRYDIEYRPAGETNFLPAGNSGSDTRGTIDGLREETIHELRVQAVNAAGPSPWSEPLHASTGSYATASALSLSAAGFAAIHLAPEDSRHAVSVASEVSQIAVVATPDASGGAVTVSPASPVALSFGDNRIEITVTAPDKTTRVYTITVTRENLAPPQTPPDIVLIVANDLGYGDLGYTGATQIETPNIDALAAAGIAFSNGYVAHPSCSASQAALMTGRHPARFRLERDLAYAPYDQRHGLDNDERLFPKRLRAAGYDTAMVGKWHLGAAAGFAPRSRGFDRFFGFLGSEHDHFASVANSTADLVPLIDDKRPFNLDGYLTDVLTDKAIEFVQTARSVPYLLYLAYNAPAAPLQAPADLIDLYSGVPGDRGTYLAMIDSVDRNVGRLLAAVDTVGRRDKTLIFFLSDNGGPTAWADNGSLRGAKGDLHEGGVRVPFVASWPERWPTGVSYAPMVVSMDVAATARAMASVPPATNADGVNLDPFLRGEIDEPPHEALFWRDSAGDQHYAVRAGDLKLVGNVGVPTAALYDLAGDPGETTDLLAGDTAAANALGALWNAWNADNLPGSATPGIDSYEAALANHVEMYARRARNRAARTGFEAVLPPEQE